MTTSPLDLAVAIVEAVDAKDLDRLTALVDEDVTVRFASADPVHGRTGFAPLTQQAFDAVAATEHRVVEKWQPEPDVVVLTLDVTYRRWDGVEVRLPVCDVFRFTDGRVGDYRIYVDMAPVFATA